MASKCLAFALQDLIRQPWEDFFLVKHPGRCFGGKNERCKQSGMTKKSKQSSRETVKPFKILLVKIKC